MDSDPYSNNSFIEVNKIEPYISFKNENGIKSFSAIFLNDETETIIFSGAEFTEDYKFLKGNMDCLSMRTCEYMAIKKAIKDGFDIRELKHYKPKFAFETNILVTDTDALVVLDGIEVPYHSSRIDDLVLEDLKVRNKIDRFNNYIINYNRRLSTSVFRNIEADELRKDIKVISKSTQKVKTA
ncbi:MAG: hypothetical protein IKG40_02255 [Bacilli bacterium]|nr:hypothetical protein [Bacilli bacterium]